MEIQPSLGNITLLNDSLFLKSITDLLIKKEQKLRVIYLTAKEMHILHIWYII